MGADLSVTDARSMQRAQAGAYGALATSFYDADKPRAGDAELAWYRARLPRDAGPVLEAMAGSGRLLVPLAEDGLRVHGVDLSEAMLASCAARLKSAGIEARLFRQELGTTFVQWRQQVLLAKALTMAARKLPMATAR